MATETRLTAANGTYLGKIEESDNVRRLTDASGRYLGQYDRNSNKTTKANGTYVGQGDLLGTLLGER